MLAQAKDWARRIKLDVVAVYFAARHPTTPLPLRLLAMAVAAYALSPIDLIPDFVPILGYLDDLLIVPLGIALVIRLLPPTILQASRAKAAVLMERPHSRIAAIVVVCCWVGALALTAIWLLHRLV